MKKIVIEELFPEFNNLYGDRGNILYLEKKLETANIDYEIVETHLFDEPYFINNKVDILYIGPSAEKQQKIQIERLLNYKLEIEKRIDENGVILATGNAFEIFGMYIETPQKEKIECLNLFPYYAKQFSRLRYNDCSVGEFNGMMITGFKNLLSHSYGENPYPFLKMKKGCGMNKDTDLEGIHKNNLFATYHTGPILPLNPEFTKYLLSLVLEDYVDTQIPFENKAYENRIKELLK